MRPEPGVLDLALEKIEEQQAEIESHGGPVREMEGQGEPWAGSEINFLTY